MSELEALRAEVERLRPLRDGLGNLAKENTALRARIQKLEGIGDAMAAICGHNDLSAHGGQQEINDWVEFRESSKGTEPEGSEYHWCGCTKDGTSKCPIHSKPTP